MDHTRRHQDDTKTFEELTFAEQAKAINIKIVWIARAVSAHMRRAQKENRSTERVRQKCIGQLRRLVERLHGRV